MPCFRILLNTANPFPQWAHCSVLHVSPGLTYSRVESNAGHFFKWQRTIRGRRSSASIDLMIIWEANKIFSVEVILQLFLLITTAQTHLCNKLNFSLTRRNLMCEFLIDIQAKLYWQYLRLMEVWFRLDFSLSAGPLSDTCPNMISLSRSTFRGKIQ